MVRLVNIILPKDHHDLVIPTIQKLTKDYIYHLNVYKTQDHCHATFKTKDKQLQYVLEVIQDTGCGVTFGSVDVMTVVLSKPAVFNPFGDDNNRTSTSHKKKRAYRISDRMTVDEIAAFVDDGNHLTFNYIAQLTMASLIAGAGLLGDSATTVIASMLVSPLMGPILSITFGLAVQDRETIRKGFRNEFVGIFISLFTGLIMGIIASGFYSPQYRAEQMVSRGERKHFSLTIITL
jgi:hypothetical protein